MWPTDENREAWDEIHRRRAEAAARRPGIPQVVREHLPELGGKHVLHLMCGTGESTAELAALGGLVTAIDASEEALAAAREKAPEAVFLRSDVHDLPLELKRGRFDLVYVDPGTLPRLRDLRAWAAEAAAALRSGGELVIHDRHPVAECVDPVDLRWRLSYFEDEGFWRLGEIVTAVAEAGLVVRRLEETPWLEEGRRHDPRVPGDFLLIATKP